MRSRLHKDKIILIGHSWGSVIGTRMVQRRPDLFAAYVGTGQFNSLEDGSHDLFAAAMARAKARGDARAIESKSSRFDSNAMCPNSQRRRFSFRERTIGRCRHRRP